MVWIIGWCVFMAVAAYNYSGENIGTAAISFGFWFLVLMAARVLFLRACQPKSPKPETDYPVGIKHQ